MLENYATYLAILATFFGSLMAIANFAQAFKIHQEKSSNDVSLLMYFILFLGVIVWTLYGLSIGDFAITFTNSIGTIAIITVLIAYFKYKKTKKN